MNTATAAAYLCLAALAAPAAAPAQQPSGDGVPRGRIVERVRSESDTSRTYALYLPSQWTPERKWPLLVLIDPGGHALVPVERFRAAAERRGWILMSGYEVGNGDSVAMARNDVSVDAILADAQQHLSIDPRRLYLGGFSGMARYSWLAARALDPHVAGVIGAGAGFPSASTLWVAALRNVHPFAFFATTGSTDFNLDEVLAMDSVLDATAFPHRVARFDGGHQWPPEEVAEEAVDWLELQAVQTGAAPRDTAFVDSMYRAEMARAQGFEQAGRRLDALREYRAILSDFQGLHDVAAAQVRAVALERDPAVARERSRRHAFALQYDQYRYAVANLANVLAADTAAALRAPTVLRLAELHRQEQDSAADRDAAHTATRMLNAATIGFADRAGMLIEQQRWANAVAVLRVARQIRPECAGICYPLARALAQMHDTAAALDALACAVDGHAVRHATLDADALLEPLRSDPRYDTIAARAP